MDTKLKRFSVIAVIVVLVHALADMLPLSKQLKANAVISNNGFNSNKLMYYAYHALVTLVGLYTADYLIANDVVPLN